MRVVILISTLALAAIAASPLRAEQAAASAGPSEHAVRIVLERIERHDGDLRAVIALNPAAVAQARALDRERARGASRGPLHGVPVLIKDNIETLELPTTAGSLALAGNATGRDARLVERLRERGLVILGKTNLSEWANFRSERSSSGWSGVGGQTRNPHDPTRSPCGSSSGSAVAVAAGYVPLAVGTETNGSIICPAAVNGIVGIKPTVGLVSRHGIVPIAHSQDTAGPMATSVRDAALLLDAMTAREPADPAAPADPALFERSLAAAAVDDGLRGKRIGVVRSLAGFHEGVDAAFERALVDLAEGGATLVDGLAFPEYPKGFDGAAYDLLLHEFKHDLNAYLSGLPGAAGGLTLERLIDFNARHAEVEMKWFQQEIFLEAQATTGLESEVYREALQHVQGFSRAGIDDLLAGHDLDLLVSPSNTPAWKIDLVVGDRWLGGSSSFPARAGYPHVTVPMGFVHGVPAGLSLYATAFAEPVLVAAAHAYEQRSRRARTPRGFAPWAAATGR